MQSRVIYGKMRGSVSYWTIGVETVSPSQQQTGLAGVTHVCR
jgi:hypothetical protein